MSTTHQFITPTLPSPPLDCPATSIRNVDFQQQRTLLARMDEILRVSGLETAFCTRSRAYHQQHRRKTPMTDAEAARFDERSRIALRCHLLRNFTLDSLRESSCALVSHRLWQEFCLVTPVTAPSKSQLSRFDAWLPADELRQVVLDLNRRATQTDATGQSLLGLATPVALGSAWGDSTALTTPIHYPVDWLLIRDAIRTLILAIQCIRAHGLCCRMPTPARFLRTINHLCIRMSHAKRLDKSPAQKRILRAMLRVLTLVEAHARRHRRRLCEAWEQTGLTIAEAHRIAQRITPILDHLPPLRTQVTQRLLLGQPVPASSKLLSLYHPTTCVLVRGKTGRLVEYGHPLWLVEQRDGLILDWHLATTNTLDPTLAAASITRLVDGYAGQVQTLTTDRGCDGPEVRTALDTAGIRNAVMPRSTRELRHRQEDPLFRAVQRRRSQTEARISIVKHHFLGLALRAQSNPARARAVTWAILTHNLWVLARLPCATGLPVAA